MDTAQLRIQLDELEEEFNRFLSTNLHSVEILNLKKHFKHFKNHFEAELQQENAKSISEASSLVANVSHEIRTPLNGIIGFVDLLHETPLNDAQKEIANALNSASQGLMNIINELLEFSKLAAGEEKFEKLPFNLKNLIGELQFLSDTLIIDRDIELSFSVDESVPAQLIGDPSKLTQVLLNLLGNAIKFVQSGSISLKVDLLSVAEGKVVLSFSVSDTGIGIAEEDLNNIFDTYHQVSPNSGRGTGLGLSIVKQIVTQLGGTISVKSTLGKGTTFCFDMPFWQNLNVKKPISAEHQTFSDEFVLSRKKILVFEDNTLNQRLFETQLKKWGCEVTLVANGIDGLKLLERNEFDLVLMDLRLPFLNGFEVSQKIRNDFQSAIKAVPILAISADFTVGDKKKCEEVGINDFLLKPYQSTTLKNKIGILLKEKSDTAIELGETDETKAEEPLTDLEPLFKECMGQVALLDELIHLFKNNILEFIGETKIHIQSRNFQGVDFAAHKVKSCLGMVKANALNVLTKKMSDLAKKGQNMDEIDALYQTFIELYPKTEQELDQKLKKLTLKA